MGVVAGLREELWHKAPSPQLLAVLSGAGPSREEKMVGEKGGEKEKTSSQKRWAGFQQPGDAVVSPEWFSLGCVLLHPAGGTSPVLPLPMFEHPGVFWFSLISDKTPCLRLAPSAKPLLVALRNRSRHSISRGA